MGPSYLQEYTHRPSSALNTVRQTTAGCEIIIHHHSLVGRKEAARPTSVLITPVLKSKDVRFSSTRVREERADTMSAHAMSRTR